MTEFLVFTVVLFMLTVIDTYIGKSENNDKYQDESTRGPVEEPNEDTPSWKLYSGTLMFMPAILKKAYLYSIEWKLLKARRILVADGMCEVEGCTETEYLQLHHVTYERLTQEELGDVRLVCSCHHNTIHDKLGYDRATKYPVN